MSNLYTDFVRVELNLKYNFLFFLLLKNCIS